MASRTANKAPVAPLVTPMADILKLSLKEQCARFAERATVQQRAFSEMGKLHHAISATLKKGQTIYGELRKQGVKDSTISNASYASRVWGDVIAAGHLTELDYDGFTFADCLAVTRAMGEKSKRRLTGEDIAMIVRAKPTEFDAELESIFNTGLTVEEAEAQAKAAADLAAEQERLLAEQKAAANQPPVPAPAPAPMPAPVAATPTAVVPSAAPAPVAPVAGPATTEAAPIAENVTPTVTTENAPVAPPAVVPLPTNVVQMPAAPAADPDAALPEVLSAIDELAVVISGMSIEARQKVFAKFNECLEILGAAPSKAEAVA